MRKFWYGLLGAILGAVFGGAAMAFVASAAFNGEDVAEAVCMAVCGLPSILIGAGIGVSTALRVLQNVHDKKVNGDDHRKVRWYVATWIFVSLGLIFALGWGSEQFGGPPSDQKLIDNFQSHSAEFDQTRRLLQHNSALEEVGDTLPSPHDPPIVGVSPESTRVYQNHLKSCRVTCGLRIRDTQQDVKFSSWSAGSALSSERDKGYAYLSSPPAHVQDSLDRNLPDGTAPDTYYRHLEGDWYLYYDYAPD